MEYRHLRSFLELYLRIEPQGDVKNALKGFVKVEEPEVVKLLIDELRQLLAQDITDAELLGLLESKANYVPPPRFVGARDFVVHLFEMLQVYGPARTAERPFDIFVSYSSADRSSAERLAMELRQQGFSVWLDQWEILVGHNIVDEVFKGIRRSDFMIVLLTEQSCKSAWVTEELTQGRLREIEKQRVRVLPVLLEKCEVPEPLRTKKYADFTSDWRVGFRQLLMGLHVFRFEEGLRSTTRPTESRKVERLERFHGDVLDHIAGLEWPSKEAYKDVLIGLPDDVESTVPKQELESLIRDCSVELRNYGGSPFPFEPYPRSTLERLMDGIRVYDIGPSPFADWYFEYWRMTESLCFMSRSAIEEDHLLSERGGTIAKNTFEVSWLLKDVCCPMMFAHRLLIKLGVRTSILVRFAWGGLKDRRLISLSRRRVPIMAEYKSSTDRFDKDVWLDPESDLEKIALEATSELFWLFGWERFPKEITAKDIETILESRFPV